MWASARWSWVAHFCFFLHLLGCIKHVKIFRVGIVTNKTQCLFPLSKAQPLICFQIHDRFDVFHESLAQTSLWSFPSVPGFHCCLAVATCVWHEPKFSLVDGVHPKDWLLFGLVKHAGKFCSNHSCALSLQRNQYIATFKPTRVFYSRIQQTVFIDLL